jgi:uncharacterized membrane protein
MATFITATTWFICVFIIIICIIHTIQIVIATITSITISIRAQNTFVQIPDMIVPLLHWFLNCEWIQEKNLKKKKK